MGSCCSQDIGCVQDGAAPTMAVHDSPLTDSLRIVHGCDWQGGTQGLSLVSSAMISMHKNVSELFRLPKLATQLHDVIHQFPRLQLAAQILPLSHTLLRIELTITPDFEWNVHVHGSSLSFIVLVEDVDEEQVLFIDHLPHSQMC